MSHPRPPVRGPPAFYDTRRTREVYRYFEPFSALSLGSPVWLDLTNADAVAAHRPRSSPDKSLTALCQLVAVKLQVRRAMVFLFDDDNGYILGEATKSLSLQGDAKHDVDDELWLGYSVIPKGFTVCEHTTNLPENHGSNQFLPSAARLHIINDLKHDDRFRNRPYVTAGPMARFYAGAPLITPRGQRIGALCALDREPRNGLTDQEGDFLLDVASTIMEHLEIMRARAEYRRGAKMVAGLGAFVNSVTDTVAYSVTDTAAYSVTDTAAYSVDTATPAPVLSSDSGSDESGSSLSTRKDPYSPACVEPATPPTPTGDGPAPPDTPTFGSQSDRSQSLAPSDVSTKTARIANDGASPPHDQHQAYHLAATVIQKALDADGVVFFDASFNTYGGLSRAQGQSFAHTAISSDGSVSESDVDVSPFASTKPAIGPASADLPCTILGAAFGTEAAIHQRAVSQRVLRGLCRNHQRGKIWNFGVKDDVSDSFGADAQPCSSPSTSPHRRTKREKRQRRLEEEIANLQSSIPSARCLAFIPMRDHAAGRWRAAAVVYSSAPMRTFSDEAELSFLSVFCDVILAESARNEETLLSRAKSAFMSLISHELRTPLHGILGTLEQLYEENSRTVAGKLMAQIDHCGRNLLDIVNRLLDFSDVHQQSKEMDPHQDKDPVRYETDEVRQRLQSLQVDRSLVVALDKFTEEIVEATLVSHHHSTAITESLDVSRVRTMLRIDKSAGVEWSCRVNQGAWKRICGNLISNALKFTRQGYILIDLHQDAARDGSAPLKRLARLRIEDTGCGMSPSFVANSLFKSFAKEDAFAPGAGLGMITVAQLVQANGGYIDVQSSPEKGTVVIASVPIDLDPLTNETDHWRLQSISGGTQAIGLLGRLAKPSKASTRAEQSCGIQRTVIVQSLEDFGIVVHPQLDTFQDSIANFVAEDDIDAVCQQLVSARSSGDAQHFSHITQRPLVVLCDSHMSAQRLEARQAKELSFKADLTHYITSPYGPHRLADTIRSFLQDMRSPAKGSRDESMMRRPPLLRLDSSNPHILTSLRKPRWLEREGSSDSADAEQHHGHSRPSEAGPNIPVSQPVPSDEAANVLRAAPLDGASGHVATTPQHNGLNLLLVDDNAVNLRLLTMYCEKNGHGYRQACDGLEAVTIFKEAFTGSQEPFSRRQIDLDTGAKEAMASPSTAPFDAILLDINMPVMGGFEAAQHIRALEAEASTPAASPVLILALTGLTDPAARAEAFASGIDMFFSKPVKLKDLTNILRARFPGR